MHASLPRNVIYEHVYQARKWEREARERGKRFRGRNRKRRDHFQSDARGKRSKRSISCSQIAILWSRVHDHAIDVNDKLAKLSKRKSAFQSYLGIQKLTLPQRRAVPSRGELSNRSRLCPGSLIRPSCAYFWHSFMRGEYSG